LLGCGNFPHTIGSSTISPLLDMTLHAIRSASALGLAVLLAACGGGQADQPAQTAMAVQSGSDALAAVQAGTPAPDQTGAPLAPRVAANMPVPDCAAEGCKGLRIIDANAEAYRYEALRRAAADGNATNT
jgi:molybdopterin biosynthesis enzyme